MQEIIEIQKFQLKKKKKFHRYPKKKKRQIHDQLIFKNYDRSLTIQV